jgi:hypothetical protein
MTSDPYSGPDILEARIPADLRPWLGMAIVLHDHGPDEPCTRRCNSYVMED